MTLADDDSDRVGGTSGVAPDDNLEAAQPAASDSRDSTASDEAAEAPEAIEEATPAEPAATPEEAPDFRQEAIDKINELVVDSDDKNLNQRYRGVFGRINRFFNSEGKRTRAETLEEVGKWEENKKWRGIDKKWIRIGLMGGGGLGVAAAMTLTGGLGAVITPILWSMGVRSGWNSALEVVEQLKWGKGRNKLELETQTVLSAKIEALKQVVASGEATRATYEQALNEMLEAQQQVQERQLSNIKSEHNWALGRTIASSVLTIGTGVFAGVPLGTHHYKGIPDYHAKEGVNFAFDQQHRVFWNFRGGQFLYNHGELQPGWFEALKNTGDWHIFQKIFGTAHLLGQGLPAAEKAGLIAGFTLASYPAFEQFYLKHARRRREARQNARSAATATAAPASRESAPSGGTTTVEETPTPTPTPTPTEPPPPTEKAVTAEEGGKTGEGAGATPITDEAAKKTEEEEELTVEQLQEFLADLERRGKDNYEDAEQIDIRIKEIVGMRKRIINNASIPPETRENAKAITFGELARLRRLKRWKQEE